MRYTVSISAVVAWVAGPRDYSYTDWLWWYYPWPLHTDVYKVTLTAPIKGNCWLSYSYSITRGPQQQYLVNSSANYGVKILTENWFEVSLTFFSIMPSPLHQFLIKLDARYKIIHNSAGVVRAIKATHIKNFTVSYLVLRIELIVPNMASQVHI